MKKLLLFLFLGVSIFSCKTKNNPETNSKENPVGATADMPGKIIFIKNCKICHGADGTLGLSGAANLSISVLTVDEKVKVITNGRKGMTSFKQVLTPQQIQQVAEYIDTLKK